jgi:cohesin complex subunit SCC1
MANRADRAAALAGDATPTGPKKKKSVRVIFDETTELDAHDSLSQAARRAKDLSAILQPQRFISGNAALIRFGEIRQDPLAYYLPTRTRADGEVVLYAGPPDLGPELAQMFEFPVTGLLRRRREAGEDDAAVRKRQRLEAGLDADDDGDVELGRRTERGKSLAGGADDTFDFAGMGGQPDDHLDFGDMGGQPVDEDRPFNPDDPAFDDFGGGIDYQPADVAGGNFLDDQLVLDEARSDRARSVISERSGLSGASNGPRGARRARAGSSRAGSAARSLGAEDDEETESQRVREKQRALGVLRAQLGKPAASAVEGDFAFIDNVVDEKVLDFKTVNAQVSPRRSSSCLCRRLLIQPFRHQSNRKAAAGFFFELLVLGTKDAVKLTQATPYGDIQVRAKERLFDDAIVA